ncbi:protein CHROMATIN REMODELING 20-like isoform X4 [Coffea arabica]|uniref:ATP-dependent helicase ATRX n=1 Tax=Coffea arabica TaxID=13443 RepID=A0ABM4VN91_COFAR
MDEEKENRDEEQAEEIEEVSASSDSFIDDADDMNDDVSHPEQPLTEQEIEDLLNELIEVESKAAEAQEALEEESLAKVEAEVREELRQALAGDELENVAAEEMEIFKEDWENVLDELEKESANLLEQLDGAGIELPSLYKWIESQVPLGCCTEAWKTRTHWVGSQGTSDAKDSVAAAEKYLQIHRPVRRRHGKTLEEGASGFLGKKLAITAGSEVARDNMGTDWDKFAELCSDKSNLDGISFGSKEWASVYLASTPQQAAELGLNFPGVDEVEEISDVEDNSIDPFIADAIANEGDLSLTEEQKRNFRKVKDEDDAKVSRKLQSHLKRKRNIRRCKEEVLGKEVFAENGSLGCPVPSNLCSNHSLKKSSLENGYSPDGNLDDAFQMHETSSNVDVENLKSNADSVMVAQLRPCILVNSQDLNCSDDCDGLGCHNPNMDGSPPPRCYASRMVDICDLTNNGDKMTSSNFPLERQNKHFRCTACDKVSWEAHLHPLLKVSICLDCKNLMESKIQEDLDCSECYCGWCGQNSDLKSCRSCKNFFCAGCIKRNLGEKILLQVQKTGWQCCCCIPSMLQDLTLQLEKVVESDGLTDSSSDTDSDDSDANIDIVIGTKRRQQKKIRRILDDAELGEETKRKIAIEKERQERLKSLGAQISKRSSILKSTSCNWNSPERRTVEVLDDPLRGYIVNNVRDEGEDPIWIPPSISVKLKPHQLEGVRFMWENIIQSVKKVKSGDKGLGCILAHTMGLGKTFQVIAFLYAAMRSVDLGLRCVLIVTPVSVLHNWRIEFNKWQPSEVKPLRIYMLEDVPRERRAELLAKWRRKGGVFLIGYSAFRNLSLGKHIKDRHIARDICCALQDGPDILVCDEAHMIKNTRADVTQALKLVKCQRRIALTGSPLQNNLMEYYCMVDFVREGFLGSSHEFRNRFQNPIENGQHTNSTAEDVKIMNQRSHILYKQLKGFVQRMDMNVVKDDLPPKTVFVIAVKLSSLQKKLYKRFLDVHGFTKDKVLGEKMRKRCFFVGYQALAQIWNHPGVLQLMKEDKDSVRHEDVVENFGGDDSSSDENVDYNLIAGEKLGRNDNGYLHQDWWRDLLQENTYKEVDYGGKMVLLLDVLTLCSNMGDKALVFSQSLSTLDLIEFYLSKLPRPGKLGKCWKRGKDWYRLDGRTAGSERQKMVERFNEPSNRRVKCILISTRAGSLGINLHAANRVIIVDGSWNPTYDLQAIFRVWRYGQTKPVFAYRLLGHGTMEEKIYKRQVTKEGLAARVVDRQQVHRTISKEEMLHLFDFGDDENPDPLHELGQEKIDAADSHVSSNIGAVLKQKIPLTSGSTSSDKLMQTLIARHQPRWIAHYHEHETLLQENEEEKLSKEEQEMAWEVYRRTFEWEEVQRVSPDASRFDQPEKNNKFAHEQQTVPLEETSFDEKPARRNTVPSAPEINLESTTSRARNRMITRKCTNLSHLLTLRSQGTKMGCSTVCGECAREISWEELSKTSGK